MKRKTGGYKEVRKENGTCKLTCVKASIKKHGMDVFSGYVWSSVISLIQLLLKYCNDPDYKLSAVEACPRLIPAEENTTDPQI